MVRRLLALALLLTACVPLAQAPAEQPTAAAQQALHPLSGLPVVPLTISQNGKVHHFQVELAATEPQQARGLMFREKMGPDEGMIFPFDPPQLTSFWMKNTVLPLDIIFVGPDHRITNVSANAAPYSLEPRLSDDLSIGVLELNGGRLAQLGFTPGAKVEW
jgi:uncharacterized membrane protein (UPF0127 family)